MDGRLTRTRARRSYHPTITLDTGVLECVPEFVYLGSPVTKDNDCSAEINRRINLASQRLGMLTSSSELNIRTKIDLLVACVFSRLLYAAETRIIKATDSRKLLAFEMRCYRRYSKCVGKTKWATALSLHDSQRGKAEEVTTVRAHLQDEWPATDEDTDAGNGGGQSTSWTTCKKMVWRHQRLVCSVCSLPEAVQLASDREKYTRIMALFPIMQKLQNSPYCKMLIQLQ